MTNNTSIDCAEFLSECETTATASDQVNSSFISDVSSNTSIDCADLLSKCEKIEEPAANNDVNQS